MSNEKEAFEAFCAEWDRQANEYGARLTREQRDCAEEAWSAALAWAATQQAPVAWSVKTADDLLIFQGEEHAAHYTEKWGYPVTPLYAHPAPAECAVPAGWQLVPDELADDLYDACERAVRKDYGWDGLSEIMDSIDAAYKHKPLSAAPKPQGGA